MAYQTYVHQPLHLPPGLHELGMDVGPGVGAARSHVATGLVIIGERPVHQVQVQVLRAEVF